MISPRKILSPRPERLAAKIEELAERWPRHTERQCVRAYLCSEVGGVSASRLRRELGLGRGSDAGYVERGRRLVRAAVRDGRITKAELLAWLKA